MNSLQQGIIYNKKMNVNKYVIERKNKYNLGDICEGMTTQAINKENEDLTSELLDLKNEYNEELVKYKSKYNEYLTYYKENKESNTILLGEVSSINDKLKKLSNEILIASGKIDDSSDILYPTLNNNRKVIINESKILEKDRSKLIELQSDITKMRNEYNENMEDITGKSFRYMAYTIGAVALGSIAYYKVISS